jgi:putative heme transporter
VVEGSLTIALLSFDGSQSSTSEAVLLYRLLSFWALLPIGWGAWAATNWDLRRRETRRNAAVAAAEIEADVAATNEMVERAEAAVESTTEGAK